MKEVPRTPLKKTQNWRSKPVHNRGEGLHPGARNSPLQRVGGRFAFGVSWTTVRRIKVSLILGNQEEARPEQLVRHRQLRASRRGHSANRLLHLSDTTPWRRQRRPSSVVTDAGGDAYAKDYRDNVLVTRSASNFKPKGDHNVFKDFPNDLDCEVCRMIKIARARCKNTLVKRADGIPRPTTLGELVTADHQISNLNDE